MDHAGREINVCFYFSNIESVCDILFYELAAPPITFHVFLAHSAVLMNGMKRTRLVRDKVGVSK